MTAADPYAGRGTVTYVTTPSTDELEEAWFELMQGELGLDVDRAATEWFQATTDHLRRYGQASPLMTTDGEELRAISSRETARRLVRAYAELLYGSTR